MTQFAGTTTKFSFSKLTLLALAALAGTVPPPDLAADDDVVRTLARRRGEKRGVVGQPR